MDMPDSARRRQSSHQAGRAPLRTPHVPPTDTDQPLQRVACTALTPPAPSRPSAGPAEVWALTSVPLPLLAVVVESAALQLLTVVLRKRRGVCYITATNVTPRRSH